MRLMVKKGNEPASQVELGQMLWELEGQLAVVVDDRQGIYYCGWQELIAAYISKGKKG